MSDDLELSILELRCIEMAKQYLSLASHFYQCDFTIAGIHFDLKGRSAGQVRFPVSNFRKVASDPLIRINSMLLVQYGERFISEVVPHECAHVVVYHLFQRDRSLWKIKPKPHGREWQRVMREVFSMEPGVTHNFVLPDSSNKKFHYQCACLGKQHELSLIRHNKVNRGQTRYLCRHCGNRLDPIRMMA